MFDPFQVESMGQAVAIILTPEVGLSSGERWVKETAWLRQTIGELRGPMVLDFGCGVGRLASLCPKGGTMIGVDASASMVALAVGVAAPWYYPMDSRTFGLILSLTEGELFSDALAIWSLQHVREIERAIATIRESMVIGGVLRVLNRVERWLVGRDGWEHDGADVREMLEAKHGFGLLREVDVPRHLCAEGAWYAEFERQG